MDLNELENRRKDIKQKISRMDKKYGNNCFLAHDLHLYLSCFGKDNREQLEGLMKEDLVKWEVELDEAKKLRNAYQEQVKQMLKQQADQLAALMIHQSHHVPYVADSGRSNIKVTHA